MDGQIIKAYEPRQVQVKGVSCVIEELFTLEDGQEKRISRNLEQAAGDFTKTEATNPLPSQKTLHGDLGALERSPESNCVNSPGNCDESRQKANSEALSVGAVVRHRLNSDLVGRIVSLDTTSARIELLTWPTDWWKQWGSRPVPVLVENLELAE